MTTPTCQEKCGNAAITTPKFQEKCFKIVMAIRNDRKLIAAARIFAPGANKDSIRIRSLELRERDGVLCVRYCLRRKLR